MTHQALASGGNVPVFVGFEKQHESAFRAVTRRVKFGTGLLATGFLLQVVAVLL